MKKLIFYFIILSAITIKAVTLSECINLAEENSKLLNAYKHISKSYYYMYKQNKAELFPQISLSAEADYNNNFQEIIGLQVSLDIQKIFSQYPHLTYLQLEKSKLFNQTIQYSIEKNISPLYYQYYILSQKKENYKNAIKNFELHLKDINRLKSIGFDTGLSITRVKMKINSLTLTLESLNSQIENILASLNMAMDSQYSEHDFSIMEAPQINIDKNFFDNIEDTLTNKITHLAQYQLENLNYKMEETKYEQGKYNGFPLLQFGINNNLYTPLFRNYDYSAYISTSFPLFDFGKLLNEKKSLKENYISQKYLFKDFKKNFILKINQLVTKIEDLQKSYLSTKTNLMESAKSIHQASLLYQKNKLQEIDVLDIYSQKLDAQNSLYDVMQDYINKKLELDFMLKEGK